jgi:hypothetical protein
MRSKRKLRMKVTKDEHSISKALWLTFQTGSSVMGLDKEPSEVFSNSRPEPLNSSLWTPT